MAFQFSELTLRRCGKLMIFVLVLLTPGSLLILPIWMLVRRHGQRGGMGFIPALQTSCARAYQQVRTRIDYRRSLRVVD